MCPVLALAEWAYVCKQLQIPRSGYVFRKKIGPNAVSANITDCMVRYLHVRLSTN